MAPHSWDDERSEETWSSSRLRAWSREYADKRKAEKLAFKLEPLTEEALADLRSGRPISGTELRYLRKMRGVSLYDISERTKISLMTLRFVEQDRHGDLPAAIYLRGFIDQYVKLLQLPDETVEQYMRSLPRPRP